MAEVDVITREVIRTRLDGVVREMQVAVLRTGYSTIIRESHDFSAGILDRNGNAIGQHSPFPPHLGGYPECIRGVLEYYNYEDMAEGDCYLVSHAYFSGCPHPYDMALVMPVFHAGELVAFCASMGHKSDIGGQSPGSRNALARDVFGEGLQILPVKFLARHRKVEETERFIEANSRAPQLVLGDLHAQAGALSSIGAARLKGLMDTYGKEVVLSAFEQIGASAEARLRQEFATWEDGAYEAEVAMEDIADRGSFIRLHVTAIVAGDRLTLDFTGSGDQSAGPINVRPPFVRGMAYFATVTMVDPSMPNNFGLARAVECLFRPGSILDPIFPAPTGFYSTTLGILEDVVFLALSKASSRPLTVQGGIGGIVVLGNTGGHGRRYVQYELMMKGKGATEVGDGWAGAGHSWSGGSRLASIEILESEFDVELLRFETIPDSGGAGEHRGGLAQWRDYLITRPSSFAGGATRLEVPLDSLAGGARGIDAAVIINPDGPDPRRYDGLVSNLLLKPGDVLRIQTGGGNGVGAPSRRDHARVVRDLRNRFITAETAHKVYGLSEAEIEHALQLSA